MAYVSLHQHTTYSLNDAIGSVEDVVKQAANLGMGAIALTDHGVIKGFPDLYKHTKATGIKPIYGVEAYYTDVPLGETPPAGREYSHVVLLAQNLTGYHNIVKLCSVAGTEGFYRKPRVSWNEIEQNHEGIIVLTACAGGLLNKPILDGEPEKAVERLNKWAELFKDRFYLELQKHDTTATELVTLLNPQLEEWAKKYNLPLVVTNDSHYLCHTHTKTHEVLLCKQRKEKLNSKNRKYFYDESFYFKDEHDMLDLFPDHRHAVHLSGEIAEQIERFDPQQQEYNFPQAYINNIWVTEADATELLRERCEQRLKELGKDTDPIYTERLATELKVIDEFDFCNYFLVVSDELEWCRSNSIPVGPGRGSAANSLVNYLCKITAFDPIPYNLDFSRFLNEGRVQIGPDGKKTFTSMIDVDCDISQNGRDQFLLHLKEKYGNVYHLGTNQRYTCKTAVKTVGSVMDIDHKVMLGLTKLMLEKEPGTDKLISLEWNLNQPAVADYVKQHKLDRVMELAKGLDKMMCAEGVHASGIVISRDPIEHICPVRKSSKHQFPIIDFDMKSADTFCKQIKFDFLGLRNVTVIEETEKLIRKRYPDVFIPSDAEFTHDEVYEARYGLDNVFQLSSPVAKRYYNKIKPRNERELSDVIALIRPGALTSGWADKYASGGYTHKIDVMNDLLKDTRGIIVYQEQLMEVAKAVGGFNSSKADDLRYACGKKDVDKMNKVLGEFRDGALKNGYTIEEVTYIIEQMKDSALYSFNLGHAMSYAVLAYKTLWLKHFYPVEFYCATLNSLLNKRKELDAVIADIKKNGFNILPPSVNHSEEMFSVLYLDDGPPSILIGLRGIKGIGDKPAEHIIAKRPYQSLDDFWMNTSKKYANRKVCMSLAQAGAFDDIEPNRNNALSYAEERQIVYEDWEMAFMEKEVLGAYFSMNPYAQHECFQRYDIRKPMDLTDHLYNHPTTIVGFVEDLNYLTSKAKNPYFTAKLTDGVSSVSFMGFGAAVNTYKNLLNKAVSDRVPVVLHGEFMCDIKDDDDMMDTEVTLDDFKIMLWRDSYIKEYRTEEGELKIRVLPGDVEEVAALLPEGTSEVTVYSLGGESKRVSTELDQNTIELLKKVYNAVVKFEKT